MAFISARIEREIGITLLSEPGRSWLKQASSSLPLAINLSFVQNSKLVMLAIAIMFADMFLGDLDIGPASSRIYLLTAGSAIVAVQVARGQVRLFSSTLAATIAISYLIFIGWASFNIFLRGGAAVETIEHLGSTILYGWLLMVFAQAIMRRPKDAQMLVGALALMTIMTALVATLQWIGVNAAWELGRLLRPDESFNSSTTVSGLNSTSISLGYNLLVGGSLFMGIVLWTPWRHRSKYLWIGFGFAILGAAFIFAVSRSAIGAGAIAIGMFGIIHFFTHLGRGAVKWPLLIVVAIIMSGAIVVGTDLRYEWMSKGVAGRWPSKPHGENYSSRYSLKKIISLSNAERESLWSLAIDSWLDSPIVGDQPAYESNFNERKMTDPNLASLTAPHNLVLNSIVTYGAVGTTIIFIFLGLVGWLTVSTVRSTYGDAILGPVVIAASISLVAFLINAQFHNESFVSGSTLGFWVVTLLVGCDRIYRSKELENM